MTGWMKALGLVGALGLTSTAVTVLLFPAAQMATHQELFAQTPAVEQVSEADIAGAEQLSRAFKAAARVLRPAVVKITAKVEARDLSRRGFSGLPEDLRGFLPEELFREFGRQPRQLPRRENRSEKIPAGVGSGVIVTSNGYILTNNHVIDEADELEVHLSDGKTFAAKVVGNDPKTDVAVIKVDASGLIPAKLGDSDLVDVGDWVIAIGSPFELEQSVTAGIISATNRAEVGILKNGGYEDFLQTDAAINPGNSGGPLVNLRGEVIGINTAIKSSVGTNAGIGFAIPSNLAQFVLQGLLKEGKVVRGYIGAELGDLDEASLKGRTLPTGVTRGVVISQVVKNSPASKGGLQNGDIVTAIGGRNVSSVQEMRRLVSQTTPGNTVVLQVVRDGKRLPVRITVEEFSEEKLASMRVIVKELGIEVKDMTPNIAEQLDLQADQKGAVVVNSENRYFLQDDVIVAINNQKIEMASEVPDAISKGIRSLSIEIIRDGRQGQMTFSIN